MTLRFRKPELIPTLVTLCMVAITFYLGIWQLQRLQWKNQIIASIEQAQAAPPLDLAADMTPEQLTQAEWHNIVASGILLHDKELHATPRYLKGILGYGVLTPLAVTTKQGVRYVLVNRGWVAPEQKDPNTRKEGNPAGKVTVEGTIRSGATAGGGFTQIRFRPDNRPDKNLWYWYDLKVMSDHLALPLLPIIIDASLLRDEHGTTLTQGPHPFPIEIAIRNDHKGYAITWFLIGLAAIGVYGMYYLEPVRSRKDPTKS